MELQGPVSRLGEHGVVIAFLLAAPMVVLPFLVISEPPFAALFVVFVVPPALVLAVVHGAGGRRKKWSSLVAIATLPALFVVASYPIGTKRAGDDATQCENRHPAGQGAIAYCIKQRQEQRWGPWQAWGSNHSTD